MSVSFYIRGEGFDCDQWGNDVAGYLKSDQDRILPVTWSIGFSHVDPDDLDGSIVLRSYHWVLPEGGIRGVNFGPSDDGIEISLNTFASPADFKFADQLLKFGADRGGTVQDEEEKPVSPGNDLADYFQLHWDFGKSSIKGIMSREEETKSVTLPITTFGVKVDEDDLELSESDLIGRIQGRVERYATSFHPGVMAVQIDGKEAHFIVYSDRPTLIPKDIDGVTVVDNCESCQPVIISLESFLDAMGALAEEAGNSWFVGKVGYLEEPSLRSRFDGIPPLAGEAFEGRGGGEDVNVGDMEILMKMPIYVFFFIAGADGKVDEKETRMFLGMLKNVEHAPSEVFRSITAQLVDQFEAVFADVVEHDFPNLPAAMATARNIIESAIEDPGEKQLYKYCLMTLGKEIASASGGFLGFGSKISKSERASLEALRDLLGVPEFEI